MPVNPYTLELHKALNAGKFSRNELNANADRIPTLGHLIEKIAFLIGYRPDANGNFSKEEEQKLVKRTISADTEINPEEIGVNNFGEKGMMFRNPNNRFSGKQIVNDEVTIVQDIPQIWFSILDALNLSFNIQESSAVQINTAKGDIRYNNYLELMVEMVSQLHDLQEIVRATNISSLVTQGQTTEIVAGLGLPSVTKTIPININGKNQQLPYQGVAPNRSIAQEIATVAYNVGIVTGQLI